jgi:hypothetical protein
MSIIVRNSQLNDETVASLNKLVDVDINANIAFKLMRIIKEISSIVEDKTKMEQMIINKHAEKDENGKVIQAKDENGNLIPGGVNIKDMDLFSAEMSNLMEFENEIGYEKINFEDLNLKTAKVRDLMKLEFLFN